MSKKHVHLRPKRPASPEGEAQALDALVKWGMDCKADFDRREAAKKRAAEAGSSPPPSASPMAAKAK